MRGLEITALGITEKSVKLLLETIGEIPWVSLHIDDILMAIESL